MSYFYINQDNSGAHRYDVSRFMEYSEGVHDTFTSYLLSRISDLPVYGQYRIQAPSRPDIYSRDIYRTTDHWQLLLIYNNVVLIEELTPGKILLYPDINALETIYFSLNALSRGFGS